MIRFQSTRPVRGGTDLLLQHRDALSISIHPPRAGRDDHLGNVTDMVTEFQSTRPVRGGTDNVRPFVVAHMISIHPPRAGRDFGFDKHLICSFLFQSTRPVRGGTIFHPPPFEHRQFQSTRPVRGGTRKASSECHHCRISIHPPRAGRDQGHSGYLETGADFNPPAPCGAGLSLTVCPTTRGMISIHPPRAGRDFRGNIGDDENLISIHPPRAGRDRDVQAFTLQILEFQSTRPVRGGTTRWRRGVGGLRYFNPPAPCGAGPTRFPPFSRGAPFQSTRPVRGGTEGRQYGRCEVYYFNPPAPCGAGLLLLGTFHR